MAKEEESKDRFLVDLLHSIKTIKSELTSLRSKIETARVFDGMSEPDKAGAWDRPRLSSVKKTYPKAADADPESALLFNEHNGQRLTLETPFRAPFTLSAKLRNVRGIEDDFSFGERTPPMPFVAGPLGMYRTDEYSMELYLGRRNHKAIEIDNSGTWMDIVISVGTETTSVFVDGKSIGTHDTPADSWVRAVSLGCGHRNRTWNGYLAHLVIKKGEIGPSEIEAGTAGRDPATLFNFDGRYILKS